ncbi:DUF401 family protein, partial [Nitrospirota bacterium]
FVSYRYGVREIVKVVRHGVSLDVVVLITGVMLFKETMESTGAVGNISLAFEAYGIPLLPALLILPALVGLLTGLTIGFVGATFPLLATLAGPDMLPALACAFGAGFVGVLLSPTHVCLLLTREYFCSDMGKVYSRMTVPALVILLASAGEYFVLKVILN